MRYPFLRHETGGIRNQTNIDANASFAAAVKLPACLMLHQRYLRLLQGFKTIRKSGRLFVPSRRSNGWRPTGSGRYSLVDCVNASMTIGAMPMCGLSSL